MDSTGFNPNAYVYKLVHRLTGEYYFGSRYANIKLGLSPIDDLGIVYFTSCSYINQSNFNQYDPHIIFENSCADKAYDYEQELIRNNWGDTSMLNRHWYTRGKCRFKVTDAGIAKIRATNRQKRWFNNGRDERHEIQCPFGYSPGRVKNPFPDATGNTNMLGKKYVTDDQGKAKYVLPSEIPEGFKKSLRPISIECRAKISRTMKDGAAHASGKRWFTNGVDSKLTYECPDGRMEGRTFKWQRPLASEP